MKKGSQIGGCGSKKKPLIHQPSTFDFQTFASIRGSNSSTSSPSMFNVGRSMFDVRLLLPPPITNHK